MQIPEPQQRLLLDTARSAIVTTLRHLPPSLPAAGHDPLLAMPAGCFVSLHDARSHRLRGCVGRLQAPDPLIRTVYETAVSVLSDPRFRSAPVTLEELPRLTLEVSVLSPLKPAPSPLDFEPLEDGIYVQIPGPDGLTRTGTFLPQVARETGWTRQQLLARLCTEKMGLPADAWRRPDARLLTYRTVILGPVPFVPPPTATPAPPGSLRANTNTFRT